MTEPLSNLAQAALGYARRGWPIVPLHTPKGTDVCSCSKGAQCPRIGKHPRTKNGLDDASTNERQVAAWWKRTPNANIGVRTGADAGIFVLDVDVDEDKNGFLTLLDLEAEHGALPATLCARTGRGGRHLIFRHPGGDVRIANSAEKTLGKGLDVRGDGGYIVAPHSLHQSGNRYEWENDLEPAEAPAWLVERVKKGATQSSERHAPSTVVSIADERAKRFGQGALDSEAKELASCGTGGRNANLNRAAFRIAQLAAACGISEWTAFGALMDAAEACGLLRDDGKDQAEKTFRSGWKKGLAEPRELPPPTRASATVPRTAAPPPPAPVVEEADDFSEGLIAEYEGMVAVQEEEEEEDDLDPEREELETGGGDSGDGGYSGPAPHIEVTAGELDRVVTEAEVALMRSGIQVYQRGGRLVRPIRQAHMTMRGIKRGDGSMLVREIEEPWLVEALTKAARFQRFDARMDRLKTVDCPVVVARTYMARDGSWQVPPLLGIIEAPTLRPDGTILEAPGYDRETGLLFNPGRTKFVPIPQQPTPNDAQDAVERLKELLSGFPFEQPHDLSIALAAILTGLVRRSVPTAPLFAFNAPKMGSGKSLLADVVSLFVTGRRASVMTPAANPEEEAKRLLAVLMEGDPVVCVDNISAAWSSDAMCTVLTQETWTARVLGSTKTASAPTSVTWLATGNNLTFVGDLTTRVMRCDLDPQTERPEERAFDVNLHNYIPENRGELVPAALTILRAYEVAGRPKQDIMPYGRFDDWSNWVRSALVWAGLADPCLCRADLEASDTVRTGLVSVLSSWYAATGSNRVTAQNIVGLARLPENADLQAALMEVASAGSEISPKRLGRWLAKYEKRIEGGFRLVKDGEHQRAALWKVIKTDVSFVSNVNLFSSTQEKTQKENAKSHEQSEADSQNSQNSLGLFEEGDA